MEADWIIVMLMAACLFWLVGKLIVSFFKSE